MSVLVKYDNGANMTYHLTAYSVSCHSFGIETKLTSSHGKDTGSCSTGTKVDSNLKLLNHPTEPQWSREVNPQERPTARKPYLTRVIRRSPFNNSGRRKRTSHSKSVQEVTVSQLHDRRGNKLMSRWWRRCYARPDFRSTTRTRGEIDRCHSIIRKSG